MTTNPTTVPAEVLPSQLGAGAVSQPRRDNPSTRAIAKLIHVDCCYDAMCDGVTRHLNTARRIDEARNEPDQRAADAYLLGVRDGAEAEAKRLAPELHQARIKAVRRA